MLVHFHRSIKLKTTQEFNFFPPLYNAELDRVKEGKNDDKRSI